MTFTLNGSMGQWRLVHICPVFEYVDMVGVSWCRGFSLVFVYKYSTR